ncbi:hypothetical protein CMQ_5359 [Grosmannia clavigera kw1407]|uniref:Uncharacterized protein n=1 Tax=Grosmannia clavigera (strain kw1407 / UAMH 11150) TaxID=655863 RepID=F0XBB6_GROCL|nr:uncharacterized protein CMQ_5359 [Grosmannia clavigera kw1407]EFX05097.1 hypothetical protein CMQ_5359 [Grosmannia clavigera kw1407]
MCRFTQTVYSCDHERLVYHWMCDNLRISGRRCVSHASDIEAKFVAFHVVSYLKARSLSTNGKVIGCHGWKEDSGSVPPDKCV